MTMDVLELGGARIGIGWEALQLSLPPGRVKGRPGGLACRGDILSRVTQAGLRPSELSSSRCAPLVPGAWWQLFNVLSPNKHDLECTHFLSGVRITPIVG